MFAASTFISVSSKLADGMLLNSENCDEEVMARMAREGINDVPLKLLLGIGAQTRGEAGDDGPYRFEKGLDKIAVPVQVMSGSVDWVAPAAAVLALAARLNGPDVRYREMGRACGDHADYGHGDLLVGRSAPERFSPCSSIFSRRSIDPPAYGVAFKVSDRLCEPRNVPPLVKAGSTVPLRDRLRVMVTSQESVSSPATTSRAFLAICSVCSPETQSNVPVFAWMQSPVTS